MINPLLQEYIDSKMEQPTVILPCRILLAHHKQYGAQAAMTKAAIGENFNAVCGQYGVTRFRSDYVTRQCGDDRNGITQTGGQFHIRSTFLRGMDTNDYDQIIQQIDDHWTTFQIQQDQLISEVQMLLENGDSDNQKHYVKSMIMERETAKKGQAFEVSSFAVLHVYLTSLGFTLNRYSTTYSNDGGIDFSAQNAIYQVTTKLNRSKFEEDLKKVPGKKRVLVYKDLAGNFDTQMFNHELIINHISKSDLCDLLDYLYQKNPGKYLPDILDVMKSEFKREFYQ